MQPHPSANSHGVIQGHPQNMALGRDNLLRTIEVMLEPLMVVFTLLGTAFAVDGHIDPPYLLLAAVAFALAFPGRPRLSKPLYKVVLKTLASWLVIALPLLFFVWAGHLLEYYDRRILLYWLGVAPVGVVAAHLVLRLAAPLLLAIQGEASLVAVVGMNAQGIELARRMGLDPYGHTHLLGFFDDRNCDRLECAVSPYRVLGTINDLPAYAKQHPLNIIYLSLPMATQPRIQKLLSELRDTTASIYFVPDIFVTDLIQGRMDSVAGMPVVAVCETPFTGWSGFMKRLSDLIIATGMLILLSPLMLLIALGVKLTSSGPVLFRQRRYGLDGQEITVYKFRSMSVCEDGDSIRQAQKDDCRVTPLGGFLRRTSLDELPQFINVLQGRMSVVGPRPHAVAHNELYRKVIQGYMIRHKVRPGITGWAQVCGFRGETDTLEKMQKRLEFDLEYLRNWSLRFDFYILLKTLLVVFRDKNAY